MIRVRPSGRPAVRLAWKKINVGHCARTFQPVLFIPAMLIGTIDFYHTIFIDLDLGWASRGQREVKPLDFIIAHFSADQYEIGDTVEAIAVELPDTTF